MNAAPVEEVRKFLELLASGPSVKFSDLSPAQARAATKEMVATLDAPADPSVKMTDYELLRADEPAVSLRCYSNKYQADTGPLILYLHGGGWVTGDIESYDSFCSDIASKTSLRVVSVEYRKAPESPFPAAYEDALAVAHWLLSGNSPLNCPEGLVVSGDSAGGGIAAALAQALAAEKQFVQAQLLFYPVLDIARRAPSYLENAKGYLLESADMDYFIDQYVPDAGHRNDIRCSPLLAESKEGLPPLIIVTCELDVLRDEGRKYAADLIQSGVAVYYIEALGHIHGMATLRGVIPSCRVVMEQAMDTLMQVLKVRR